jgi:hypothetical protein
MCRAHIDYASLEVLVDTLILALEGYECPETDCHHQSFASQKVVASVLLSSHHEYSYLPVKYITHSKLIINEQWIENMNIYKYKAHKYI